MKENSFVTVVESTVLFYFLTFIIIRHPYDISSCDDRSRDSARNTAMASGNLIPNGLVSGQN